MRVLIVDHDPAVLDAAARSLAGLIDSVQVTGKGACLARLREGGIDIVVACERLDDGSGLDLLATLGMTEPDVLRIFAADAERLKKLGGHLTPFKLFDTIGYPLDSMQLRSAMALAIAERGDLLSGEFENIVLGEDSPAPVDDEAGAPAAIEMLPQIVLLTRDPASLDAAKAALADRQYRTIAARDADEARADLVARRPVLALIDVGALGMDPVNWFTEAHRASPGTLLLALGRRNDGQMLEALVAAGVVNRFVAKPVTHAGMRLVLDSALRMQALGAARASPAPVSVTTSDEREFDDELHGAAIAGDPADLATVDWQAPGIGRNATRRTEYRPEARTGRNTANRLLLPAVLVACGALAFGAAWWYFSGERADTPPTPVADAASAPAAAAPGADELAARIEQALTQDDVAAARAALDELQRAAANHPRAALLATLVERAEETERLARAPVPRSTTPDASRVPPASGTQDRPADIPPPASRDAAGGSPANTPGNAPGGAANVADAPPAAAPGTTSDNTREPPTPVAEPTDLRPSKLTAVSFAGRTLESAGAAPDAPLPDAPAAAAPRVPAAVSSRPADRPQPVVKELKLLRSVEPDYPGEARRRQVEGSVELQFVVGSNGRVKEVEVVDSTPPGVFDAEAVAAVKRWRYDARREDGVPVDAQARVRLEFRLDD